MLGHEIGHVTARHSVRQYTRTVGGVVALGALGVFVPAARPFGQISEQALALLFLKYGRNDELQADQLGARYEASAGWDPAGVPGMLSTLGLLDEANGDRKGIPNWLSTHPEPLARVAEIKPTVTELKAGRSNYVTNRDGLERRLDGVIYRRQSRAGRDAWQYLPPSAATIPDRLSAKVGGRQQPAASRRESARRRRVHAAPGRDEAAGTDGS